MRSTLPALAPLAAKRRFATRPRLRTIRVSCRDPSFCSCSFSSPPHPRSGKAPRPTSTAPTRSRSCTAARSTARRSCRTGSTAATPFGSASTPLPAKARFASPAPTAKPLKTWPDVAALAKVLRGGRRSLRRSGDQARRAILPTAWRPRRPGARRRRNGVAGRCLARHAPRRQRFSPQEGRCGARRTTQLRRRADRPVPGPASRGRPTRAKFVVMQTRDGYDRKVNVVRSSPDDRLQPELLTYDYRKAGDAIPQSRPRLFDVKRGRVALDDSLWPNPWSLDDVRWRADSTAFTVAYNARGHLVPPHHRRRRRDGEGAGRRRGEARHAHRLREQVLLQVAR